MSIKVLLLSTVHFSLDDRAFYHQAQSLIRNNCDVIICSTLDNRMDSRDGIIFSSRDLSESTFLSKLKWLINQIRFYKPDVILCDTPIGIIISKFVKKRKTKIIYDITEWYPSKKNLVFTSILVLPFKFILLSFLYFFAGLLSDRYIFGEYYKGLPFSYCFFWKEHITLPYYPSKKYIEKTQCKEISDEINLLYSGLISHDKGIDCVFDVVDGLAHVHPELKIRLNIIGNFSNDTEKIKFHEFTDRVSPNVVINRYEFLPFIDYCKEICKNDLFLDLRQIDFENNRCLPIKIFYYLSCGRPVIYSNLKSIRYEFKEFKPGYLVNPRDTKLIVSLISSYITQPALYKTACKTAVETSQLFTWENVENDFISFIQNE
jgi:glycosyltransferase involved in cell wall biosynthesis